MILRKCRANYEELTSLINMKIWESVILLSKRGSGQPRNMKAVCQQEDLEIIPAMRRKRSHVSKES